MERRSRPTDVWPGLSPPLADVERQLLDAIARAPSDDEPRLILADWWMAGSDPARGEFVALQCSGDAAAELRELYEDRWLGALAAAGFGALELERGFSRHPLVVYAEDPLAHAADTRRVSPRLYVVTELADLDHRRVLAGHSQDGERVAIKPALVPGDPLAERKLMIAHPHVVVLRDVARTREGDALVFAWAGTPLPSGPHPSELVAELGRQLASALAALHAEGIVHRSVHPDHILVEAGHARLAGFGGAHSAAIKTLPPYRPRRRDGDSWRHAFLAPEQARGRPASAAADVFSLGAVLASWRSGRLPFGVGAGAPEFEVITQVLGGDRELPDDPALHRLLAAMTAADPAARPTAAEVERELASVGGATTGAGD